MFRAGWIVISLLALYSVILIGIEANTSQDYVRHFVSDVEGPVPFYAINTTLSVFLLWATALFFGVCLACDRNDPNRRHARWFFLSQILMFAWLGIDDRFKAHEHIGWHLNIGDHYVLIAAAMVEIALLVFLGRSIVFRPAPMLRLSGAAFFFAVTMFFDAIYPHDAFLRLSLEDVAKTWSALFFCLFAWQLVTERIDRLNLPEHAPLAKAA